jgi:hypothetical protein
MVLRQPCNALKGAGPGIPGNPVRQVPGDWDPGVW